MSDKGSAADINEVYRERNIAVALAVTLARKAGYPVWYRPAPAESIADMGWYIVYIALPTGQVSWHVPAGDALYLPQDILQIGPDYDGHTTGEKNARIARFNHKELS